jgi:hypothetical protein
VCPDATLVVSEQLLLVMLSPLLPTVREQSLLTTSAGARQQRVISSKCIHKQQDKKAADKQSS